MKANTLAIIARCKDSGLIGAAVASKFPGVGAYSPCVEAQVGAIATQGWFNPSLGPLGLAMLREGATANEVLNQLLFVDPGRELRQVAVMDRFGNSAAYTGTENDDFKGHIVDDHVCIIGNLLTGREVLQSTLDTFTRSEGDPLQDRLLEALVVGERLGGDKRGKQSAVLRVESVRYFPYIDFRVDDHEEPVQELCRIYHANKAELILRYHEWVDSVKQGIKLENMTTRPK